MANRLGGASRLTIALTVAVAFALIVGTAYICLVTVGVHMLPPPLNDLFLLSLVTTIITLTQAWQGSRAREEMQTFRREQDERDGRIYAALARRSGEITAEIPRPRVVASVPAVVGVDPRVVEIGTRLTRRLDDR